MNGDRQPKNSSRPFVCSLIRNPPLMSSVVLPAPAITDKYLSASRQRTARYALDALPLGLLTASVRAISSLADTLEVIAAILAILLIDKPRLLKGHAFGRAPVAMAVYFFFPAHMANA